MRPRRLLRFRSRPRAAPGRTLAWALLALLAGGPGCGSGSGGPAPSGPRAASRVLVVGMDGLEWSVLRPLLQAGKCPHLADLMRRGCFGQLSTLTLTLSPVVWTSIATGKLPKEHGILNFLDGDKVYTSSQRRVRALWNIADQHGLSTNMFGWFITWPAEELKGLVVSGSSSSALSDANWKPALVPSVERQVWPPERTGEVMTLAAEAGSQERIGAIARERIFGELPAGVLDEEQRLVQQQTLWSIAADETYFELARKYIKEAPADLNLVYFGGTDVVSHRYWRQYRPEGFKWSGDPAADAALARVVPSYYEWVDSMLGELVAAAGPQATVLVLSDHGFHASAQDQPDPQHMTGHHMDHPPGVLIAAGPGIVVQGEYDRFLQTGSLATLGSVLDVTPTVLALLGIPGARDMGGRAFLAMLAEGPAREAARLPKVETHDAGFRPPMAVDVPAEMDADFRKKFGELGYFQLQVDPGEEIDVAPAPAPGDAPR